MEGTGIEKKGIEIKSTAEIAVIGTNYMRGSSDAFLALPETTLGKTYVVATRLNSDGFSQNLVNIGIISQRDATKVTITLKTKGYFRYLDSNLFLAVNRVKWFNTWKAQFLIANIELTLTHPALSYHQTSSLLPLIVYATRYKAVPILKRELTAHYIIIIIIEEKNKNALKLNKTSNVKLNWQKAIDTGCACAIYNIDASVDVESCNDIKFGVIVAGYRLNVSVRSCGFPAANDKLCGKSY